MYAHRVGLAWEVLAPAKLNLHLDVLGPRADGFHDLESLMVPVRLYDHLRWIPSADASQPALQIRSAQPTGPALSADDPNNLVLRAAHRLADSAGIRPTGTFQLYKRIPLQAGLGGGSSDAAAALVLANAAWGIDYPINRLMTLSAEVGSDVPFFLAGGPAVCRGRGERVQRVAGLPRLHFVVAKPEESLSTAEVFGQWSKQQTAAAGAEGKHSLKKAIALLRQRFLSEAGVWMTNHLQQAASVLSPVVKRLAHLFASRGFAASSMTGSGTAYWGLARSASHANHLIGQISQRVKGQVFGVSSC